MYIQIPTQNWNDYLETSHRGGSAMKLDRILKRRMKAFLKARQARISEV